MPSGHVRSGEWLGCEHRVFTQGMIWDIDSFEQWMVDVALAAPEHSDR